MEDLSFLFEHPRRKELGIAIVELAPLLLENFNPVHGLNVTSVLKKVAFDKAGKTSYVKTSEIIKSLRLEKAPSPTWVKKLLGNAKVLKEVPESDGRFLDTPSQVFTVSLKINPKDIRYDFVSLEYSNVFAVQIPGVEVNEKQARLIEKKLTLKDSVIPAPSVPVVVDGCKKNLLSRGRIYNTVEVYPGYDDKSFIIAMEKVLSFNLTTKKSKPTK